MKIYIIRIDGYNKSVPYFEDWKPYVSHFSPSNLGTTSNPVYAKFWLTKKSAERNAKKAVEYLKNLYHPHPSATSKVLEIEFTILNP